VQISGAKARRECYLCVVADAEPKRRRGRAYWAKRAGELPDKPGVYLMKASGGEVIYVGKAKSLRARVRSYFQEGTSDYRAFIGLLSGLLEDLETVVTRSEKEALLLERELIRRHEPRFNVIWKDDKQYLCLRIDAAHEWPWVEVVRNMGKDGAKYFGPFHSATAARQTLRVINRHFQLRSCRDSVLYNRNRPCLEYQIGRCLAPCVFDVDRAKYRENVDDVVMFLEGKGEQLVSRLDERMQTASARTEYEIAAHYRDQIAAVKKTLERQQIALPSLRDQDVFGVFREDGDMCVAQLEVRKGRIQNVSTYLFEEHAWSEGAVLESYLLDRYIASEPPAEILLPVEIEGAEALSELLSERRGSRVTVSVPQRGERASLLEMAAENASHAFYERRRATGALDRTLAALKEGLGLVNIPMTIECYDISNLQGTMIVGSRVVFHRALPLKARYRHYRVKTTAGQDDFASLYEVLTRRLKKGMAEDDLPDLIVIDGGKGQLNVARAVFKDLGVENVDLISLAKSRVVQAKRAAAGGRGAEGSDSFPTSPGAVGSTEGDETIHSPERVFVPAAKDPIVLKQDSPENLLLARVRDEAHRFAITFHKSLRQKSRLRSALEDIPGVGRTRKRALLRELGSLRRVREASVEDLARVPGVGKAAAERIFRFFRASESALAVAADSGDARPGSGSGEAGPAQDASRSRPAVPSGEEKSKSDE
jgi:excinuclease ABC subunit C